jgi:DNA-binding CsgD family transcriptional regulator
VTADRLSQVLAAEVSEVLRSVAIPPLVVLAGPSGVDLAAAADELSALSKAHGPAGERLSFKSVNLLFSDPSPDFRLIDVLPPRETGRTILLIHNAQRLHPAALPAFAATIRRLAGTNTICVCTVALPLPPGTRAAFGTVFAGLRQDGLLRHVTLRPIPAARVASLVTEVLGARPEPSLASRLWELTGGWPAAIVTALEIYRDNGMMELIDQHAYLTGHRAPALSDNDELLLAIRRRGAAAWNVAKATAVLGPLGAAAPRLIGEALGIGESAAVEQLTLLKNAGTVRYRPAESTWCFRIPLVAAALRSRLGPFERRKLAQIAVTALWSGQARCADPSYLADQLVAAGRMVDRDRSRKELLANAARVAHTNGSLAIPWLRAAAELTADRAEHAGILLSHAQTCIRHGRAELALESSDLVLRGYSDQLPGGRVVPVCYLHLTAIHEAKDMATLEKIAGGWWPWPGTSLERMIAQAFALSLLGRWRETQTLLDDLRRADEAGEMAGYIRYISPVAHLWLGLADEFDADVASLPSRVEAGEEPAGELICHTGALLALGELNRAEALLDATRQFPVTLDVATQAMKAFYEGEADRGLELTRKHLATSSPNGCDAHQTVMFHLAATIHLFRGHLAGSRDLVAIAQSRHPTLPHALAVTEAWQELLLNDAGLARSILGEALRQAEESGIVAFTDLLCANLADLDRTAGHTDRLPGHLIKVEKVASRLGTETAEIRRLTLHALVHTETAAADAALALARRRGQPIEQVILMQRLVRYGLADPALLTEIHSLLGDLEAWLARAQIRLMMREYGVAVPGRQAIVAENERLLAVLITEGLSNTQIARVLLTSEKSVEGRLSRLFARTGYQSRVELATAVLSGEFDG